MTPGHKLVMEIAQKIALLARDAAHHPQGTIGVFAKMKILSATKLGIATWPGLAARLETKAIA
tara:strand:- start:890 stop:1078 length:189 start_codon:yes stop_codon:yes gene_type:complete